MWRSIRQRGTVEIEEDKERDISMSLDENTSDARTRRKGMNRLFAPTTSALRSKLLQEIRMPGHWLLLARAAWIVVALLGLVYFFC